MKILEIEIENIRGIRSKLRLEPSGQNLVVFGPNGTGKSAVVDAIDFLFSGDIKRLTGEGSQGLSIGKHGHHVDADTSDAVVTAKVAIDGVDEPVTLSRRMSDAGELQSSLEGDTNLQEALLVSSKGNYFLSRAEILRFITATAGDRSADVQTLLNLSSVEDFRKVLGTVQREAQKKLAQLEASFEGSKTSVATAVSLKAFSEHAVLEKVNECRAVHKSEPIQELKVEELKKGIKYLYEEEKRKVIPETVSTALTNIDEHVKTSHEKILKLFNELLADNKKLTDDENLRKELANLKLLNLGVSLIDETGRCPLCLTE